MLQQHVADTFLALQDLLEKNEVLILYCVDIARQIFCHLLDSQLLVLMIILIELPAQFAVQFHDVATLFNQLVSKHIAEVCVVSHPLDRRVLHVVRIL